MNGHGGRATSLRTGTRGGGGGGGEGGVGGAGGERMGRMERGGKDAPGEPQFDPYSSPPILCGRGKEFSVPWVVPER